MLGIAATIAFFALISKKNFRFEVGQAVEESRPFESFPRNLFFIPLRTFCQKC